MECVLQTWDAVTITRVIKELVKLLLKGEEYNSEVLEYEVAMIKKELESWFIEDFKLYVGS